MFRSTIKSSKLLRSMAIKKVNICRQFATGDEVVDTPTANFNDAMRSIITNFKREQFPDVNIYKGI